MNDEQLKQRIQYLIQHGGMLDDPLADIRRHTRHNRVLILITLGLTVVQIIQVVVA